MLCGAWVQRREGFLLVATLADNGRAVLTHRVATPGDLPALSVVMDTAVGKLQQGFLTPEQIESSRTIMGIDTQLAKDGTYFVVECDGQIAGCGGWSRRGAAVPLVTMAKDLSE